MQASNSEAQLLVEGKNDQHVVWALCQQYNIEKNFSVEVPGDNGGGIDALLKSIPVRLKASGFRTLGVVLDANQNLSGRWEAIKRRLTEAGYSSLPQEPELSGTIIETPGKPKVGIWLMPDNQMSGMLEYFVAHLIPPNDPLVPKAEAVLQEIERENLRRYSQAHHPKAFIHTWLAWQKSPGQPMGLAITAHTLNHNEPLARTFVSWLKQLFG